MFGLNPQDLIPVVTSFFGALVGVVGAYFSWRQQGQKLRAALMEAQAKLQDSDLNEFRAIAEGNRELREALLTRVKDCEGEIVTLRQENVRYQREVASLRHQVAELEYDLDQIRKHPHV